MLKNAYFETDNDKINSLIEDELKAGNANNFFLGGGFNYGTLWVHDSTFNGKSCVSVTENGRIIGFMSADYRYYKKKIQSCVFIKFKERCLVGDSELFRKDINEFFESLLADERFNLVEFEVCEGNRASEKNGLYREWVSKYNGRVIRLEDYCCDINGNVKDMDLFLFYRKDREGR